MSVQVIKKVRLLLGAGTAKPGPAIGQALGPLGLNMADFCKQFNERTKNHEKDVPVPVELSALSNRTYTFKVKTPPTSWFIKKCIGIEKGSGKAGHETVGSIHVKQIYEIAKIKHMDEHMSRFPLQSICRSITGTCLTMGVTIVK